MLDLFGKMDVQIGPVQTKNSKQKNSTSTKNDNGNEPTLSKQEYQSIFDTKKMAEDLDSKIETKKAEIHHQEIRSDYTKDPKVKLVYGDIGKLFASYRTGKIPRAFRILKLADQWENLIELTEPENWTPHAMYEITKAFTSEMQVDRLRTFFEKFLVPAVRKDIKEKKKLNYQYFSALQKGFWKPAAWFRGI